MGRCLPGSAPNLQNAGADVVRGFMQQEAKAVLDFYAGSAGKIYNGCL